MYTALHLCCMYITIWDLWGRIDGTNNLKGSKFEVLSKWFLQNHPHWQEILIPSSIKLWNESDLNWGPDNGIDITAQGVNGEVYAIQAKAWNPKRVLTKEAVDSFLAVSSRKEFDKRIIITTAINNSKHLDETIKNQEKDVIMINGRDLIIDKLNWDELDIFKNGQINKLSNEDLRKNKRNELREKRQEVLRSSWKELKYTIPLSIPGILFFSYLFFSCINSEPLPKEESSEVVISSAEISPSQEEDAPLIWSIPSDYEKFNEKFAYKWIQKEPTGNIPEVIISISRNPNYICDSLIDQVSVTVLRVNEEGKWTSRNIGYGDDETLVQEVSISLRDDPRATDTVVESIYCAVEGG